jgi:uncharacterized delta-60 repeat protein
MKKLTLLTALFIASVTASFAQAGTLDLTFDTDGILLLNPANLFDNAQDVLVLPDNSILLCGTTGTGSNFDMTVIKLNENGTYDNTFGTAGILTPANPLGPDYSYDMEILPNGNIIIVGAKSLSDFDTQFAAWVVKPDGTLDPTFSGDGIYEFNNDPGEEYLKAVVVSNNDIFLIGVQAIPGFSYNKIAVQKLDLLGNLDLTFGVNGTANFSTSNTNQFSIHGGTYANEGAIAICGDLYNEVAFTSSPIIVLLDLNGNPISAFGENGMWQDNGAGAYYDIEYVNSKFIAVGNNGNNSTIRRHNIDGSLDNSFANNGILNNAVGGYSSYFDVILGPDNKWYACGTSSSGFMVRDFLTSRINSNGTLDLTWAGTGNVVTSLGDSFDDANGIGLQSDGKIICGGLTAQSGNDMGVVRYQNDNGIVFITGCTNSDACNYNPDANANDGSCFFVGDPCDDGLATTENDAYNANCECQGVSSIEENDAFNVGIYPNPASHTIAISSHLTGVAKMQIIDLTGRVVLEGRVNLNTSQEIFVGNLPAGIYSCVVILDQKQAITPFVKL